MKSAGLGAVATLLVCCTFINPASATNKLDLRSLEGTLSGTAAGLSLSGSALLSINDKASHSAQASDLFSGNFSGPVTWTLITMANRTHNYSVTGVVVGTIAEVVNTITIQSTASAETKLFQSPSLAVAADTTFAGENITSISSIPEPSTFMLLLTGCIATTLGMMRRKLLGKYARDTREPRF
jgi:hypothetical protein